MSLLISPCRTGYLMFPVGAFKPSDAYHLTEDQVPQPIKDAFKAEEEAATVRAQLKSIARDLSLPTLDQEVTDRIAA